jgi:hypothetical protein
VASLSIAWGRVRLALIEPLLRSDDVGVARIERERIGMVRLSLDDLLDLDLSHPATAFPAEGFGVRDPSDDPATRKCLVSSRREGQVT